MNFKTLLPFLGLFLAGQLHAGDIRWVQAAEPIPDLGAYARQQALTRSSIFGEEPLLFERATQPAGTVILPLFEVDTTSAVGETTLYAVRNASPDPANVGIETFGRDLRIIRNETITIPPRGILTINLRDVPEVISTPESDGVSRGFVRFSAAGGDVLTGDYFQVNPGENFARGGRLVRPIDLCRNWSIRFLNGGAFSGGTDYTIAIQNPRGSDPAIHSPSLIVNIFAEGGALGGTYFGYTDQTIVTTSAAEIGGPFSFGAYEILIDDASGQGGWVGANFSATGRFSVGVDAACLDPLITP